MLTPENLLPVPDTLDAVPNGCFFSSISRMIHQHDGSVFAIRRHREEPWGIVVSQHVQNLLTKQGYLALLPVRSLRIFATEAQSKTEYVQNQVAVKPVNILCRSGDLCVILSPPNYELLRQGVLTKAA